MPEKLKKISKISIQGVIITGIYLIGLLIEKYFLHFLPGSILGMIILLFLLLSGILKVDHIAELSDFLLKNMMFFFLPSTVSIMVSYKYLSGSLIEVILLLMLSSVITLLVTGLIVKYSANSKDDYNE